MSQRLTNQIRELLRELITNISGFDSKSTEFRLCEKFAHSHVDSYHYFFNDNRKQVEERINGLAEKFQFHGFLHLGEDLTMCFNKFLDGATNEDNGRARLAMIQLLIEISESPTTYFTNHPEDFKERFKEREDQTDWGSFLNSTKVLLRQSYGDSTSEEEWSITDDESKAATGIEEIETKSTVSTQFASFRPENTEVKQKTSLTATEALETLKQTVQNTWWNTDYVCVQPETGLDTANVALKWDEFINYATMGLVTQKTSIIPEYLIIREVIWEFFTQNSCFSYEIVENALIARENISIGSVRPEALKRFLETFVPFFGMMKTFRDFNDSLLGEYFSPSIPDTYRSYNVALQDILKPARDRILEIENIVRKQTKTYTLLTLTNEIRPFFKRIEILHQIHEDLMIEFSEVDDSFTSVSYLLSRLYYALLNSTSKTEQNIYLTLYLQSLYKYLTVIEIWLSQDLLEDYSDEFVIVDGGQSIMLDNDKVKSEFVVRNLEEFSKSDGMLAIMTTTVLQLGKNIHLLRQLGKLHLIIDEQGENYESLHEEYCRTVLEGIQKYLSSNETHENSPENVTTENENSSSSFDIKNVVICPETPRSKTGMDDLTNFIDVTDGFLMNVFEKYIYKGDDEVEKTKESLYKKIDDSIDRIVPVWQILENTFRTILRNRYSVPGLMVKNLLISQYNLNKYLSLVRRLYLFESDIVFPFYKKMFAQFESNQPWGNFFWLTSKLHDLLMDHYPEQYEFVRVDVSQNWRLCTNPLEAWELVSICLKIDWPINLIIQECRMLKYRELFQFILKIKWALYTLHGLNFEEIQPRLINFKSYNPIMQQRIRRLQLMRFRLINDISSVHHYVLGHLYSMLQNKFNSSFEESYDLESLISTHNDFIDSMHLFCKNLRDNDSESFGFAKVLNLVILLKEMWSDVWNLDNESLKSCEKDYLRCNKYLRPIIEVDVLF